MSTDPRTQWREVVAPDEDARFTRYADELAALHKSWSRDRPVGRALHTKAHACLEARLEVRADVPPELRVSLFGEASTKRAYVRLSNGIGRRQKDGAPDVRGFAVKVLDVPGPKVLPGLERCTTQDFLLIHTPTVPFRDAGEFVTFLKCEAGGPLALLPRLVGALGFGRALGLVKKLATGPQPRSLPETTFYSVAPTKLGPFAAKFSLAPTAGQQGTPSKGHDGHRDDLLATLRARDLSWSLRAQLFVDEATTPIEDATVVWDAARAPWIDLATLTLPRTDLTTPEAAATAERIEALSFDPWHCTEDLRPLGEVMRARRYAYKTSAIARNAAPEP